MPTSQWHGNASCWMEKLPNELLGETFRHYVGLDDSPWRLALVCKRWKHVALSTPTLWTCIIVATGKRPGDILWDYFGISRYSNGPSSVCYDIDEIGDAARRAGILPLRVGIISKDTEDVTENLVFLMSQLFSSSFVNQIEDLLIDIPLWTGSPTILNPIFYPLSNLKSLRMISIPQHWGYLLFQTIRASSAGTLHSLALYPRVTYDLIEEAISVFTQLERLQKCPSSWPNRSTPQTTIPQLMELEIRCQYSYLTRIQLPRLQFLRIRTAPIFQAPQTDYRPNFPQLTELCAVTSNTEWLEYLVAPKLQTLSILEVVYKRVIIPPIHHLPPNLFPMVTHFTFVTSIEDYGDGDPRDSLLIAAFQSVPNAISVSVAVCSSSKFEPKLRLQLLDRLGSMEEEEILCPKLQDLELRFRTRREDPLADYETYLLQRIVDIRREMDRGLNRFTVHWNQRGDTITQRYT